jgi:hypothetical protein
MPGPLLTIAYTGACMGLIFIAQTDDDDPLPCATSSVPGKDHASTEDSS